MESRGAGASKLAGPGKGGDGCSPCVPDMPIPGVRGGSESEEPSVEPSRWETLWNEGPHLKGYCKHPSCSVNTKLDRSLSRGATQLD